MELLRFGTLEAAENMENWLLDFRDNTDIPEDVYSKYLSMCKEFLNTLTPMVDKGSTTGFTMDNASDSEELFDDIKDILSSYVNRQNVEILLLKIHTYLQGVVTTVFSINTKEQLEKTKSISNAEEQKMNTSNVNTEARIKELEEALALSESAATTIVKEVSIFDKIPGGIYTAAGLGIVAAYGIYRVGYLKGYATGKDESATIIIMDERE